jgi:hypothetical protein
MSSDPLRRTTLRRPSKDILVDALRIDEDSYAFDQHQPDAEKSAQELFARSLGLCQELRLELRRVLKITHEAPHMPWCTMAKAAACNCWKSKL